MQLLLLICLLPTVIGHGDRRGSQDGMDNGKTGRLRMRGKIMMVKGGEWGEHGMDSHENDGGWDEWSKRHEDVRGKMSSPMHGKKWWENDSGERDMDKYHGQKSWSKMDGDNDEMDREWSMDDSDDEERGKWRKGSFRHGRGDRNEDDKGTDKWEMDGFRHGKDKRRHEYRHGDMRMHQKWTHGGDSKEDEERRAYFRFFGRFNMMKGHREMMDRDQRHGSGKSRGHGDWNDDENNNDGEMMKEDGNKYSTMMIEKKLKKGMKMLYKQEPHVLGKLITLSFLKMCECEGDNASKLLKKFVAKSEHREDMEEETKRPKLPEIPDFGSDTTAKVAFLKKLTKEQRKMLFGYDLVKNMCEAAKAYIVKGKEFYDQHFAEADSMTSTTVSTP